MKVFTFIAYLFAVSAVFWLLDIGLNTLNEKCEVEQPTFPEKLKVTILGYFGYDPPEAPWWRPLCKMTGLDMSKNLITLQNYLFFCSVIVICFGSVRKRKLSMEVQSGRQTFNPLAAIVPFSTVASHSVVPKRTIVKKTDKFLNINNNNVFLKMIEGDSGCTTRSPEPCTREGLFDKVLLGPVTASLKALSQVVVATFLSYQIPSTEIQWSTKKSRSGGPSKIIAKSSTMMAEIVISDGIGLNLYRVTGLQGLIRTVSCQTYRLTYRGLVLSDESTTCMCGPGWHL